MSARLRSFLELLGEESTSEHIQVFGQIRLSEVVRLRPLFSLWLSSGGRCQQLEITSLHWEITA